MKRHKECLSAKQVEKAKKPGYYADGGGLYLQVSGNEAKSWIFRYTLKGRPKTLTKFGKPRKTDSMEMGLGPFPDIGLAEARRRASGHRTLLVDGIDPIESRNAKSAQDALAKAKAVSFQVCADAYISAHRASWKNAKHAAQWETTIKTYCTPVIGALPVQSVDTGMVLKVLEPVWSTKPETANRVRGRIESILDWATARGYRTGENPARWRGHLNKLLPAIKKESRVKHHPALPYEQMNAFMIALKAQDGTAAQALEFLILCASRTGEVIGAKPAEFDLDKALWVIPAKRMKSQREHRVPLSPRAVAIVRQQLKLNETYLFPGQKSGNPLSNMAMLKLLERMGRKDLTVHGYRSTFRDWSAEQTAYPHEVCEMALAHVVGDKVEAAYRRGDLFEKRRRLALDWAKHCEQSKKAGRVTPIRKAS